MNHEELSQLQALENRLLGIELAFETSDDWLWDLDLERRTLTFIGDWYKRLGLREMTNVGLEVIDTWLKRVHPDDNPRVLQQFQQLLTGQVNRIQTKYRILESTGDYFWVSTRLASRRNVDGYLIRIVGIHSDTDMFHTSVERLQNLAYTDMTTGLNNRIALMDHLNQRFATYDASHTNGAVLLIGLDYFKFANTTYGHYVGDRILKTISDAILEVPAPEGAFYARYESDQFCVVLNQYDESCHIDFAETILNNISKTIHIEEDDFTITASIGIAEFPLHGTSFEELLKNAESAMMAAKNAGKNTAVVYAYNMNQSLIEKWNITQELHAAIENNEMRLVYQPIIDLHTNNLIGFEALVRWHSPKLGVVPPNRFIPLAEEIGLIERMDWWVLQHAMDFIRRMNDRYCKQWYITINISSKELEKESFIKGIEELMKATQIPAHFIKIEITEHALMTSFDDSKRIMMALKDLGVEVFLDDFGTGYSSFNYLKNLPVDLVKLDMSFISDLLKDSQSERLVAGMIQLSHILNLRVCAEGIETKSQMNILKKLNCDYGQGYLFARPQEENDLCQMIETNTYNL